MTYISNMLAAAPNKSSQRSSANYVLKVNATDHLTIRNIGFDVSASSSYGTILEISGETDSLKIEGNEFRGYDYNSNSSNHYLVESTSNTGTGMVFTDNTFLQGSAGIFLTNGAATLAPVIL